MAEQIERKRVLITGVNGLLGQKLSIAFTPNRYELFGIDLAPKKTLEILPLQYHQLDLTERKETVELIKEINPDVIVHTAALTDVDGCERKKEYCWKINVDATNNVIDGGKPSKAHIIFISSDYIFDGSAGPYSETDQPNPLSYYGKTKLASENILRGQSDPWTIIRTIVLYGFGAKLRASFITWLLKELRAGNPVRIVDDQWGNMALADDLANAIERCVNLNKTGIYNVGSSDFMSRYEFAQKTAEIFELDASLITPIKTSDLKQLAERPLKSGLTIEKVQRELYITPHDTREDLKIYRDQETLYINAQIDRSPE